MYLGIPQQSDQVPFEVVPLGYGMNGRTKSRLSAREC